MERRRAPRRARPALHLAGGDERPQQHAAAQRLGRHHGDRSARRSHGGRAPAGTRRGDPRDLRARRRRLSAVARTPARRAARHQPSAVQRAPDLERPLGAHGLAPRQLARVRGEPALLARTAEDRAPELSHHPQQRHPAGRAADARSRRRRLGHREPNRSARAICTTSPSPSGWSRTSATSTSTAASRSCATCASAARSRWPSTGTR